jgi:hypothetical protein
MSKIEKEEELRWILRNDQSESDDKQKPWQKGRRKK